MLMSAEVAGISRDPATVLMMNQAKQAKQVVKYVREQNNQDDEFNQKQWQQIIVEPSEIPEIATGIFHYTCLCCSYVKSNVIIRKKEKKKSHSFLLTCLS